MVLVGSLQSPELGEYATDSVLYYNPERRSLSGVLNVLYGNSSSDRRASGIMIFLPHWDVSSRKLHTQRRGKYGLWSPTRIPEFF